MMNPQSVSMDARTPAPGLKSLAFAFALAAPLLIFLETTKSIISIWNTSETFAHGYIIFPISLWLIWQRRAQLASLPMRPCWPALLALILCGFAWLLGELAAVQVVQQYAVVAMMPLMVVAVLGTRIAWAIAFPLFFLVLAVPFGEVFIEPLMWFTADFTVAALQLTGIPVFRDGTNFIIPTGSWSVVTACSGIRYLIASFTLGCLYAYLTYRSLPRRLVFIAISIVVPILANGLRAYMIVMIGHLVGMEYAVGVDHLIYGWLFFGLVMLLMFWVGSYWREEPKAADMANRSFHAARNGAGPAGLLAAVGVTALCLGMWPVYSLLIDKTGFNPETARLDGFKSRWTSESPFTTWKPEFFPANAESHQAYTADGARVGMVIHYYRNQNRKSMLISSVNQMVSEGNDDWRKLGATVRTETVGELPLAVRETRIEGHAQKLVAWSWYWIDGRFMINNYLGKVLQARNKLLLRGDDGAAITVYAAYRDNPDEARKAMTAFLTDNVDALGSALQMNTRR